jgi:anti-repressor protein
MNQLIKITDNNGKKAVSARELYEALGFDKTHWTRWYKKNITENQFAIEHEDWQGFAIMANGNETQDFVLTIDFAKKLSMLARTEAGEKIRQYFVEVEKVAIKSIDNLSRKQILEMALEAEKQLEQTNQQLELAEKTIKLQAPKVEYVEKVLQSESLINTNVIAKDLGMSAISLNKKLHSLGIQYKSGETWVLYHKYQNQDYTHTKTYPFLDKEGNQKTAIQTYWTEKGRQFIMSIIKLQNAG